MKRSSANLRAAGTSGQSVLRRRRGPIEAKACGLAGVARKLVDPSRKQLFVFRRRSHK